MHSALLPNSETTCAGTALDTGFPFRLAAIDIDDTLVGPDRVISPENAGAIRQLRALGVRVLLASGRSHANMVPFHRELNLDTPLISANGALLREVESGKVWKRHGLPSDFIPLLIEEGRRRDFSVLIYALDAVVIDRESTFTAHDQSRNADPQRKVDDLLNVPTDGIPKLIWMGEPARIDDVRKEMAERFAGLLVVTRTDAEYLEFMPPGVTKAVGLADAAQAFGVPRQQVLAFGDGNNDTEMLAWAGIGVAMPHAKESAKATANIIVPEGSSSDALARGIMLLLDCYDFPAVTLSDVAAE